MEPGSEDISPEGVENLGVVEVSGVGGWPFTFLLTK